MKRKKELKKKNKDKERKLWKKSIKRKKRNV